MGKHVTQEQFEEAKRLLAEGSLSQKQIAERIGVPGAVICRIKFGKFKLFVRRQQAAPVQNGGYKLPGAPRKKRKPYKKRRILEHLQAPKSWEALDANRWFQWGLYQNSILVRSFKVSEAMLTILFANGMDSISKVLRIDREEFEGGLQLQLINGKLELGRQSLVDDLFDPDKEDVFMQTSGAPTLEPSSPVLEASSVSDMG